MPKILLLVYMHPSIIFSLHPYPFVWRNLIHLTKQKEYYLILTYLEQFHPHHIAHVKLETLCYPKQIWKCFACIIEISGQSYGSSPGDSRTNQSIPGLFNASLRSHETKQVLLKRLRFTLSVIVLQLIF